MGTRGPELVLTGDKVCLATTVGGPVVHLPGHSVRYLPLPRPGRYLADVTVRGHAAAARLPEANWRHGVERWIIRLITP